MTQLNESTALKVLQTVDQGLVASMGKPVPGKMCVEAAVCFALGLPHSDDPRCVSLALRDLKIRLNDAEWSSDQARAAGLRRLAIAQLGTKDTLDDVEFARRSVLMVINTTVADCLDQAGLTDHAQACRNATDLESALAAAQAAADLAGDLAPAARVAAWAARAAARAVDAAWAAEAAAAARAAAAAAVWAAASNPDQVLADFAERVVQILIDMKATGTQWLHLTEAK
jgi:hypothetical protein